MTRFQLSNNLPRAALGFGGMSDDANMLPPAGWYGDPQDQSKLRYWDGAQWTDQTRPMIDQPMVPEPQPVEQQPFATEQPSYAQEQPAYGQEQPSYATEQPAYATEQHPYTEEQPSYLTEHQQQPAAGPTAGGDQMITEQQPGEVGAGPAEYTGPPILITTMNEIPGYRITAVLGEVFGLTVRARNAFSNMGASFRTMFGGEAKGYTQLLTDTRQEAVDRLKAETAKLGGNAVVAMRYDSGAIADLMNEVAAYGTAVVVEPE